ncbi:MAG: septal ring lytic transglycosylase RlpA family protein [Gammaproteobacteria bacterium]|nr:septal ring lytic transglycosylase RlpA family protein [Gammaproteobacteria bacterium]
MNKALLSLIIISLFGCQSAKTQPVSHNQNSQSQVLSVDESGILLSEETSAENLATEDSDYNPDITHKYQYKVRGKHYKVFKSSNNFQQTGSASWYGPGFHGKKTANGEIYDMYEMTAAHKTLPLGTLVQVTNLSNRKKVTVRINDRGPFHGGRIIDLSKAAAQELDIIKSGYATVHIKTID